MEEGKLIGKISHFFGHISVGVIDLDDALKVGDKIKVVGGEAEFEQVVESMEVDRKKIDEAKKGDSVGVKLAGKAKDGYKVYKDD